MRAWDALAKAAAGRGLWPWFEPDGTLVVGGPDYTTTPVDTLIMKLDGTGNNVMELDDTRSINGCFSELTVLAQSHAQPRRQQETGGRGATGYLERGRQRAHIIRAGQR